MGVDTKLYIGQQWNIEDIKDVIEKRFDVPVTYEFHHFAPDYVVLKFQLRSAEHERGLHVHTKSHVGGLPAISLSFRSNDEGIQILKTLAETFGGLFTESDCGNTFEEYQKPGEGNIDFIIKEALKSDPTLSEGDYRMVQYIGEKKWMEHKVWPKPMKAKD